MKILERPLAIDYLSRTRSCLHPETDNFGSIPLLAKIIDIERAFLVRLSEKSKVSGIPIGLPLAFGDHGFPELSTAENDVQEALTEELNNIKTVRADSLGSFLQEFANASDKGLGRRSQNLLETVQSDQSLLQALGSLSPDQVDFFNQDWRSPSFPLYVDPRISGLLLSRTDRSPFSEKRGERKRFKDESFRVGLKYIDNQADSLNRTPLIMMCAITENNVTGFRVITPKSPLLERSEYISKDIPYEAPDGRKRSAKLEYYDLAKSKEPVKDGDSWISSADAKTVQLVEENLQELHPHLFRALHQTDYVGKSENSLNIFFDSLVKASILIDRTLDFSEKYLELKQMGSDQVENITAAIMRDTRALYDTVEDDELRLKLQSAVAAEIEPIRNKADIDKSYTKASGNQQKSRWWRFGR